MLKQVLFVGLGGGIGSILRYIVSFYTAKFYVGSFPIATFFVNILGCFLIGLLSGLLAGHFPVNANLKLLLITGFCGGYTTFSTFALENLNLLEYNHIATMVIYILASVVLGITAVWLGIYWGSAL
ncbi:fluoride efflux transporter CrcB [Dysgonomonas sp. 216]|uniref:fluoride efflux transporter CrcB n=1 Tax=Dysgonomonas sp. 216 TaxID=2302934 RepID=UPI0013D5AD50|nr:fluoride efflux transporter CrcB [Dysgonomonas sp. 216]NDW19531.1 fluoride efflux transporter CrcB [Dysgonomonas sp. 216]